MRAAADDAQRCRRRLGRVNRHRRLAAGLPRRADVVHARVSGVSNGHVDDAEHSIVPVDQRDVDRELAIARHEFLGAVERIDQPIALPLTALAIRNVAGLFGQHRYLRRERLQSVHDDLVRLRVGERERRLIRLARHFELLPVDAEDRVARAPRERDDVGEQFCIDGHVGYNPDNSSAGYSIPPSRSVFRICSAASSGDCSTVCRWISGCSGGS